VSTWRVAALAAVLGTLVPVHAARAQEYREVTAPTPEFVVPVARNDNAFPETLRRRNAGKRLEGRYMVYCARDGSVVRVEPGQSIPGADQAVSAVLKSRHFPAVRPVKFDLYVTLEFEAEPAAPPPAPTPAPAPAPTPPPAPAPTAPPPTLTKKYRAVPLPTLQAVAIDAAPPELKSANGQGGIGAYMVFVETDGTVSRVDVVQSLPGTGLDAAITARLKAWKFKKQAERVRSVVRLSVGPGGVEQM
jgi:hypothetical protein